MRCVQRRACPRPLHLNLLPPPTPLINYNTQKAPFNDIRVRHAMQMAIDLETINKTYFHGWGIITPTGHQGMGLIGNIFPFEEWPEEIKQYHRYDPEGAEKLLDEAGYPRGADGISPNPPKDTDGRREDSGRGVRELQGRWPGLHWGRWKVGGRSSVAAQGPYGRLRELRCAGWRENTQQGTLADRGGASLRGRWVSCRLAVRPGVEWLAAGPRRE